MDDKFKKLLKIKEQFFGLEKGFVLLDMFLDKLKVKKSKNQLDFLKIYDYRTNEYFFVNISNVEIYSLLQEMYINFLITEIYSQFEWFKRLSQLSVFRLEKDKEINLIHYFLLFFLRESDTKNCFSLSTFSNLLNEYLVDDVKVNLERVRLIKHLLKVLVLKDVITINNDSFSLNDKFINLNFYLSSSRIAPFFSSDLFKVKYSSLYAIKTLLPMKNYYFFNLVEDPLYLKLREFSLLHKDFLVSEVFLFNYSNLNATNFSNLPIEYQNLFDIFFLKKLLFNEYCFHTIIMSCFDSYYFDNDIKNILMDKNDPYLNLRSEEYSFYI